MKNIFINTLIFITSIIIMFFILEGIVRIKNSDMKNYSIEMWKYAKELKIKSEDPKLGFYHKPSSEAILESVKIRTNNYGLRGENITKEKTVKRRILFLGSSATLGWGVKEKDTMTVQLDKMMGKDVEVLNAGIGNYNSVRYTELFLTKLKELNPTDIVVHFFLNDAEDLHIPITNWFLKHSQLAVLVWNGISIIENNHTLLKYYNTLYDKNYIGYKNMLKALDTLSNYAKEHNIRLYFTLMPDLRYLKDKSLTPYYTQVEDLANVRRFKFLKLFKNIDKNTPPQKYFVMPTDAHPNELAHKLMAEEIYPFLQIK